MSRYLLRCEPGEPGQGFYVLWGGSQDGPVWIGSAEEWLEDGRIYSDTMLRPAERLALADQHGSSERDRAHGFDDQDPLALRLSDERLVNLPRSNLRTFAEAVVAGHGEVSDEVLAELTTETTTSE